MRGEAEQRFGDHKLLSVDNYSKSRQMNEFKRTVSQRFCLLADGPQLFDLIGRHRHEAAPVRS